MVARAGAAARHERVSETSTEGGIGRVPADAVALAHAVAGGVSGEPLPAQLRVHFLPEVDKTVLPRSLVERAAAARWSTARGPSYSGCCSQSRSALRSIAVFGNSCMRFAPRRSRVCALHSLRDKCRVHLRTGTLWIGRVLTRSLLAIHRVGSGRRPLRPRRPPAQPRHSRNLGICDGHDQLRSCSQSRAQR